MWREREDTGEQASQSFEAKLQGLF